MKKHLIILPALIILLGCVAERDLVIESDYSYRGKFKQYDSFNFLDLGDTVNFNGISDQMIRQEIEKRLQAQGYKLSKKPSFYVAYKVYGESMKMRGYDQLDLDQWDQRYAERAENEESIKYIKEATYVDRSYELKEGTLLIDFIDRKSRGVIWQGYASGLFSNQSLFSKDIRYSVRVILNEYRLLAANYRS